MSADEKLFGKGLVGPIKPETKSELKKKFIFPPFSVLNARDDLWQDRKRRWVSLGIKSELGRDYGLLNNGQVNTPDVAYRISKNYGKDQKSLLAGAGVYGDATSVFDPVLCELCYRWFCKPGGRILDPFAGGSVRGIVASVLGYRYWGNDLSKHQIESNRSQLNENTTGEFEPVWNCGDSLDEMHGAPGADFIFSCPPYGNLEKYSDHPADISNKDYGEFISTYDSIIGLTCSKLRQNRFAVFVVANFRDKITGMQRNLVADTVRAFELAGLGWWNDAILVHPCGSAPVRAAGTFERGNRKLVKLHQNVLVFVKGDPEVAAGFEG
jgi:DNA modification methylase